METGGRTDGLIWLMYWFLLHVKVTIVNRIILESEIEIIYGYGNARESVLYIVLYFITSPPRKLCTQFDTSALWCFEFWW